MKLKFITCSGLNENTDILEMVFLSEIYPKLEVAAQVSGKKCSFGSPRYEWLQKVHKYLLEKQKVMNLALHLNADWVEKFSYGKEIPEELQNLLAMRDHNGLPRFQRIQLNFRVGKENVPSIGVLVGVLRRYSEPNRKFILKFNKENETYLENFYKRFPHIDCLYDSSHGEGRIEERKSPVFNDVKVVQGYSGGLSPDNVMEELEKIANVLPDNAVFSIDAEGRLKDENGQVSLDKCEAYVSRATHWQITFHCHHLSRKPCE